MFQAPSVKAGAFACPLYSVVAHAGSFGVVLGHNGGVPIVALIQHQYEPKHRSDIQISEINDLDAMALPGGHYLIRTAKTTRWPSHVVVGMCPAKVRRDIDRAIKCEVESRQLEEKYKKAKGLDVAQPRMNVGTRHVGMMPGR